MAVVLDSRTEAPQASLSWRWVHVVVAALAMVATMPGRTQALGLITEPLGQDLQIDHVAFADVNLWATLLGALFCLPCGWLIDRLGVRIVLAGVLAALGAATLVMSRVQGNWLVSLPFLGESPVALDLFLLVLLTRGFGQSALSILSLTLVGQAAGRRPGVAIGCYSCIVGFGFMVAFGVAKEALDNWHAGWRELWSGIGWGVLAVGLVSVVLVRPSVSGWQAPLQKTDSSAEGMTLAQALRTPTFWVFATAASLYGLIYTGISLFNESILNERGFDEKVFRTITALSFLIGLAGNLVTGILATRWPMGRLLTAAMLLLGVSLVAFPLVETLVQVYLYAAALGIAGGMVTVLFFGIWGQAFGPAHLGKIQGAAQLLTVVASAVGPRLAAMSERDYGSYVPLFQAAAVASVVLALLAWRTSLPRLSQRPTAVEPEPALAN